MEKKKHFLSWYFDSNLIFRILIGLVLGAIAGLIFQDKILWIRPFGDAFIRLLMMIMVPIIFSTLVVGAASVSPSQLGKVGFRILLIYVFTSFIAVGTGLLMAAIYRPSVNLGTIGEVAGRAAETPPLPQILLNIIPTNIVTALGVHAAPVGGPNLLGIIFFTLCFGMAISIIRTTGDARMKAAAETVYNFFDGVAEVVMKIIKGIMQYAPIGVFALVAVVFAVNGSRVIGGLATVTLACYTGYISYIVIWYLLICVKLIGGLSIKRFVRNAKDAFITGFVTRSSNGTLPVTMECAVKLGIPKNVYSFALPLGATINMDGTAIYQGVCSVFIALSVWGHGFDMAQIGIVLVTATLATIGTAGVPGAGAIMLLMVLTAVGLPVEAGTAAAAAYAMILGIDALLDMGRTAINVVGDLVYCTSLCKRMGTLEMDKWS